MRGCSDEITADYEALRAFVLGDVPATVLPRRLGVLLQQGLPAWLAQWEFPAPPRTPPTRSDAETPPSLIPPALRSALVHVLVDMVVSNEVRPQ